MSDARWGKMANRLYSSFLLAVQMNRARVACGAMEWRDLVWFVSLMKLLLFCRCYSVTLFTVQGRGVLQ